MSLYPDHTRERLRHLVGRMWPNVYRERRPVPALEVCGPLPRIPYSEAKLLTDFRPAKLGDELGPLWATFWFRGEVAIPREWANRRVDLLWSSHSEALLWVDGRSVQGLNFEPKGAEGGSRVDAVLLPRAQGGEIARFEVEVACNRVFGGEVRYGDFPEQTPHFQSVGPFVLDQCEIALFDEEAWNLFHDYATLQALEAQGSRLDPAWRGELLHELNRFANAYKPDDRSTWARAVEILRALYQRKNASNAFEVSALGHSHLDTAWLWPAAETIRKCQRTFSSAVSYMERYPDFLFAASAAQHFAWVKEQNPELFERVKAKVKSGQFFPVGGMWVEPDCNLASGESIARQFLYGQRFFQQELGYRCRECWVPDTFGYNAQLPQLMRLCGIERFLTQKLSWNQFNKPSAQNFIWEGLDGSEVRTHFPFGDTYNGNGTVAQVFDGLHGYKDHNRTSDALYLFGHGDGGGGPTPAMVETLRRLADVQGAPRVTFRDPAAFFERLEQRSREWPRVVGELYVECHRGTYTSQAEVKRGNRKSELHLHEAELLCTWASRAAGVEYPAVELGALWRELLLHQFHDILPGSSIAEVYEDTRRAHLHLESACGELKRAAARKLVSGTAGITCINTVGFPRAEVALGPDGEPVWVEAPSYGLGTVRRTTEKTSVIESGRGFVLENAQLRAELDRGGQLVSLVEKSSGREAMAGFGNELELFEDVPNRYDAWDLDPMHLEQKLACAPAQTARLLRGSPLRAEVELERRIGSASSVRQVVRLDAGARRLEFLTEVDWREDHRCLKVAFPVDVRAMNATYEMQFGAVERPTHFNTSYDLARFEVPAHRWVDLSEHGFGVALLSESKYGFSTHRNVMRMTLLRAPTYPDPRADRGVHRFTYAVLPHRGDWREGDVVAEAIRFNAPVWLVPGAADPTGFASVDSPGVVVDTVKRAEDDDAVIVRLYEAHGGRRTSRLNVGFPFREAKIVNLLEEELGPAKVVGSAVELTLRPFEIVTVKLC